MFENIKKIGKLGVTAVVVVALEKIISERSARIRGKLGVDDLNRRLEDAESENKRLRMILDEQLVRSYAEELNHRCGGRPN